MSLTGEPDGAPMKTLGCRVQATRGLGVQGSRGSCVSGFRRFRGSGVPGVWGLKVLGASRVRCRSGSIFDFVHPHVNA